jgi:hypothetical protein
MKKTAVKNLVILFLKFPFAACYCGERAVKSWLHDASVAGCGWRGLDHPLPHRRLPQRCGRDDLAILLPLVRKQHEKLVVWS